MNISRLIYRGENILHSLARGPVAATWTSKPAAKNKRKKLVLIKSNLFCLAR